MTSKPEEGRFLSKAATTLISAGSIVLKAVPAFRVQWASRVYTFGAAGRLKGVRAQLDSGFGETGECTL